MFTWLKRTKPPSTAAQNESPPPPPSIRKPQHAYRDARMSIPIAEREFYETIQARQARRLASFASSVSGGGQWKGKARSPLGGSSGSGSASYRSTTPGSSERAFSHHGSSSSHSSENTDLIGAWEEFMRQGARGQDPCRTELSELAESSRSAVAREREMEMEGRGEE